MGLPMHTDKTPFVLSPFWTSPPLLQMTGNSRPCKSMILDFTHLSHGSTCMLEVAQQLTPVSGIFLRDLWHLWEPYSRWRFQWTPLFLGQCRGQPQWQRTRWSSFRSWPASFQHRWTQQACRTSRRHELLHWPYPLQQWSPKQVNLETHQSRGQQSSTVWGALPSQICQSSFQVQTSI